MALKKMKKAIFGKKGVSHWSTLLAIVLFGLMVLFYFGFIRGTLSPIMDDTIKEMAELLRSRDYDGDGRRDWWDPCPCSGVLTEQVWEISGVPHCTVHMDYCDRNLGGFFVHEGAGDREFCAYKRDDCLRYIAEVYKGDKLAVGVTLPVNGGNND